VDVPKEVAYKSGKQPLQKERLKQKVNYQETSLAQEASIVVRKAQPYGQAF